ncbi:tetratricopeptide repeat protein [Streptomyces griseosporeus]|uniref:tetratricopeptide repeat protein n=1 Tax=Streptomyces griseosporeus TaxID=1910 RepID=UPI0037B1DCE3
MSRLSREKRENKPEPGGSAVPPLDVHVPASGPDAGRASISGVPVVPAEGEELQQAVLGHLYRIARATGRPVYATVRDERIGYAVPLRVDPDGSSHLTAEPVATTGPVATGPVLTTGPVATGPAGRGGAPAAQAATGPTGGAHGVGAPTGPTAGAPAAQAATGPTAGVKPHVEPMAGTEAATEARPPAPQGAFGPPPVMPPPEPAPAPDTTSRPGSTRTPTPDSAPTPPRGFDAVAEAVLGDGPTVGAGMPSLLAAKVEDINEAVRSGRIAAASELAEHTVGDAVRVLGPEHAEVLRLRELAAYVAYLAGDPVRAFRLSLDLARVHHRACDADAAYGNVQSAATAWRAVRDPLQGLDLGRDLLGLWVELTAGDGPAADDIEELDSARARMTRLADRADRADRAAARGTGGDQG